MQEAAITAQQGPEEMENKDSLKPQIKKMANPSNLHSGHGFFSN